LWYRVRQFWRAITARISQSDYRFIQQQLSPGEQALFFQMAVIDQRHCLDAAFLAQAMGQALGVGEKQLQAITKAALLHDVGKVAGDEGLWDRVLITLLQSVSPKLVRKYAAEGSCGMSRLGKRKGFAYACFVHLSHVERGAHMLASFGCETEIVRLVERHHLTRAPESTEEEARLLAILQQADQAK